MKTPVFKNWVDLRNKVIFHYEENEREIPEALQTVTRKYAYSWSHFGNKNERTFHELAFEVIDAIGAKYLKFSYGDEAESIRVVADLKPMIKAIRVFASLLIRAYVKEYELTISVPEELLAPLPRQTRKRQKH